MNDDDGPPGSIRWLNPDDPIPQRIRPERQLAAGHKSAIADLLKTLAEACEAARGDGFYPEFQVSLNQFGIYVASPVFLVKRF